MIMSEERAEYKTVGRVWHPTSELAFFDVPVKLLSETHDGHDASYHPQLFQKFRRDDGTEKWEMVPHKGIWND